jgi:hypothetical protein
LAALKGASGRLVYSLTGRSKTICFLFALYLRTGFASANVNVIVKVLKFFPFNLLPMSGI